MYRGTIMINTSSPNNIMSKLFRKNNDNKKVNLETSKEINDRVIKKSNDWNQTSTGAELQQKLVELLVTNTGRRDPKWIQEFIAIRNQCMKLDIWEGFIDKYNLHRGFTAEYV
tara:strand:- start:486 stop:824 length:339 start_codon:yes stop_codon:yes gene_type:complete